MTRTGPPSGRSGRTDTQSTFVARIGRLTRLCSSGPMGGALRPKENGVASPMVPPGLQPRSRAGPFGSASVHESRMTSVLESIERRSDFADASVDPTEAAKDAGGAPAPGDTERRVLGWPEAEWL